MDTLDKAAPEELSGSQAAAVGSGGVQSGAL